MIFQKRHDFPTIIFFFLSLIGLTSCEKFSGNQTIPSYLSINSIALSTDYITQGSASNAITDAWVYVDGESIGVFQMPARFPVLREGYHTVMIKSGVKKDGIASTRIIYDFYAPVQKNIKLVMDSTVALTTLNTTYLSTTKFLWNEDFEDIAITLDTSNRSTVSIENTPAGSPLVFEGVYSGIVTMIADTDFFECSTHNEYDIPSNAVFLEMNFRTNNTLLVGVFIYMDVLIYQVPIMTLFATDGVWKKIYIDLTTTLNAYSGARKFKIFFNTFKNTGISHAEILLDNLKIVTR